MSMDTPFPVPLPGPGEHEETAPDPSGIPDHPGPPDQDAACPPSPLDQYWDDLDPAAEKSTDAPTGTPAHSTGTEQMRHPGRAVLTGLLAVVRAAILAALVVGALWLADQFVSLGPDTPASDWARTFMAVAFYPLVALILVGRWWADLDQRGTSDMVARPLALLTVALIVYPNLFVPDLVWCDWWTRMVVHPGLLSQAQTSVVLIAGLWFLMAGFLVCSVQTTIALVRRATPPPRRGIQPADEEPS